MATEPLGRTGARAEKIPWRGEALQPATSKQGAEDKLVLAYALKRAEAAVQELKTALFELRRHNWDGGSGQPFWIATHAGKNVAPETYRGVLSKPSLRDTSQKAGHVVGGGAPYRSP